VLFRYRPISDHLLQDLIDSSLYFSTPPNLNDPFDCQVDIRECLSKAISETEGEPKKYLETLAKLPKFSSSLQRALTEVGICSFSLTVDNPLLWAHYAANHTGVCLAYRIPEAFFAAEVNEIIGVAPTEYGASPLREWLKGTAPALGSPASRTMGTEMCKKLFTVKGDCWSYEKEIRAIRAQPGALKIPREFLAQVCFGLRTSAEDIAVVQGCLEKDTKVAYCRVIRDGTDFGISIKDI
jgi:hypothetical protein